MATSSSSSTASSGGRRSSREGTAKAMVAEQISQAIQSTSNLLQLMQQSSPSQAHLIKLPRSLLAKTSTIKNTGQVCGSFAQLFLEDGYLLCNSPSSSRHLVDVSVEFEAGVGTDASGNFILGCTYGKWITKTVIQLLSNMENSQLNPVSQADRSPEEPEVADQPPVALH